MRKNVSVRATVRGCKRCKCWNIQDLRGNVRALGVLGGVEAPGLSPFAGGLL